MSENSQDVTIGNQQERLFFEIGYIVAMIDGEGCCQFRYKYLYPGSKVFAPCITIYNANPNIIQRTKESLDYLQVPYLVYMSKMHGKEQWQGWRIEIIGLRRIKKLTDIILKYPFGKKDRVKVLEEFSTYRLAQKKKKYSSKENKFFEQLKNLNRMYRGKQRTESSETIRSTLKI